MHRDNSRTAAARNARQVPEFPRAADYPPGPDSTAHTDLLNPETPDPSSKEHGKLDFHRKVFCSHMLQ